MFDFYECDICNFIHPWSFIGDCREDGNRFNSEDIPDDARLGTTDDRLAADEQEDSK